MEALEPDEVDFVYRVFSEIVYLLENEGLFVLKSCQPCFSRKLHTRLDELLNGSEDGSISHMPSGLPKEDCTWCVKSKSRGLSCSPNTPASRSGGACSTDIPTHSSESSHSSDNPVPTGREECHSNGLNGLMIEQDSLQRNSTPVLHGMNSTHAYSTSNGCDSVLQLLETDGGHTSVQKILNFSSDSELDLQSHSTTGEESSVELFSDVSGNGGDAHGTSGMEESSPVDTNGDDEESITNEQPPPVDPPCPDDSVGEGKSELVEVRTADSGNSDSSDDDDQFEEFLLSTRKTMEAKSAKKCSPQRFSLDGFIVSDSDSSVELVDSKDLSPSKQGNKRSTKTIVINLDSSDCVTPNSKAVSDSDEVLEVGMKRLNIREPAPPEPPHSPSLGRSGSEQYETFVESIRASVNTADGQKRKSIQAFILSDNCGEILEEELEGEGENKVVVVDERDPEVLSAPHSRQAGLMSPLSVPSGLLSPLNVHSRLLSPQIAHSNLPFPTVPSLGGPSQNKENIFKTPATSQKELFSQSITKQQRVQVAKDAFEEFNCTVFDNMLPSDTPIVWNARMTKTAGFCKYQSCDKVTIELSNKVCDTFDRIRQTLLHEMCHAAVWLIDGKRDGHGPYWRAWANKAGMVYPDIEVSRCHSFDIKAKFLYKCTRCDYCLQRHSKSVNLTRNVCPHCFSSLALHKSDGTPYVPRKPNVFATYVKENYSQLKQEKPHLSHSDIMKQLSANFKCCK